MFHGKIKKKCKNTRNTYIWVRILSHVNPENLARTLFSRTTLKDIFATSNICNWALFTNISKGQSDFVISRGFYSHKTSPL